MDRYIFCCTQDNSKDINIALFYSQKKFISHTYILQKHGAQFINKLAYGNIFHIFGNFRSSINIYQYLHNIPYDSHEKFDSYLETANIYECQGNFLQAYHYRKIALEIRNYLFKDKVDPIEFLGYYSFEKAQRFIDEGWSLYSSYTGEYTDWSIVEAVELFGRAIDILEKLYGDKPQSMEVLETLASAYEGSYIAEEISKITDWRNDYNKYLELNRLIEEKKKK